MKTKIKHLTKKTLVSTARLWHNNDKVLTRK